MAEILKMPSLSPTMEDGIIESWEKQIGDFVETGDLLAHIETDKAIVEYEFLNEGYLRHFFANPGDKVPVGEPIAIFSESQDEDIEDLIASASVGTPSAETAPETKEEPAPATENNTSEATSTPLTSDVPEQTDYDVAVIGAGPGGYVAAIRAAQLGLKTVLIDKQWLGGVCLNVGCIPSKALLNNAELVHTVKDRGKEFGISFKDLKVDYSVAVKRSRQTSEQLTKGIAYLAKKNKIDVRMAKASFKDAHTLELVDEKGKTSTLTTKNTIVATGAHVRGIPDVDVDGKVITTYHEAILQEKLPKSAIIIGSGAIGVEFATIWNAYGVDVTVVEMQPNIVPLEDTEVSKALQKAFKQRGIQTLTETRVESITKKGRKAEVTISDAKGEQTLKTDQVLVAIGFVPNSRNLGLEDLGIEFSGENIVVNEHMQTNHPNIYAIGDVTGKLMLAHVGSAMGLIASENIAGHPTHPLDYLMMPRATYCQPQIASFGHTEAQAKEQGYDVKVAKFPFSANGKALGLGAGDGFVKIVTDAKYGEILGAHFIGPEVTELLPEFTLAQATELTIEEIARNVHAHPTLSETLMEAAHGLVGGYIHI